MKATRFRSWSASPNAENTSVSAGRGSRLRGFALLGALAVVGGAVAIFAAQRRTADALTLGSG
jgi:hypothetical protein